MKDVMKNTSYGKAALKKFGAVPEGFEIFSAGWIEEKPEHWKTMRVSGAQFVGRKRIPRTTMTTIVTVEEKQADETGRILYSPSMPGNKTGQALPYFFDLVLALRVERDGEGVTQRALMCDTDGIWQAKDRSGKLNAWESPDMGEIIKKIGGVK
jgi:hypothetical protein